MASTRNWTVDLALRAGGVALLGGSGLALALLRTRVVGPVLPATVGNLLLAFGSFFALSFGSALAVLGRFLLVKVAVPSPWLPALRRATGGRTAWESHAD